MRGKKIIGQPTLNGKPIQLTDSWDKMTFSQYLKVLKMKDIYDKISIVTGIDSEVLRKASIKGLNKVLYTAQFMDKEPKFPDKPVHIGKYKLPLNSKGIFDIQFESLAQFEDMRQVMAKTEPTIHAHTKSYATYCAIYLQKLRDGEYDGDKALQMVSEIMEYPASDVIVAGGFFFVWLQSLSIGTRSNSQTSAPHRTKHIGKRSRKNSVRTQRLTKRQGR